MVIVHNRRSPPDRIWVSGRKSELIEAGITDIISEHNWGNWIFSIPRKDYEEKIKRVLDEKMS